MDSIEADLLLELTHQSLYSFFIPEILFRKPIHFGDLVDFPAIDAPPFADQSSHLLGAWNQMNM
jgi:hypothetical protein